MLKLIFRSEILFIIAAAFFSALSGFLLKAGAGKVNEGSFFTFDTIFPYLVALLSYGLGFFAYSLALRSMNVSLAYPGMVGMSIFFIFSWNLFSGFEALTMRGIIGSILVIFGAYLTLSSSVK